MPEFIRFCPHFVIIREFLAPTPKVIVEKDCEFISAEVITKVNEGKIMEGDGESSDMTVANDEVVPPIVVKDQNINRALLPLKIWPP